MPGSEQLHRLTDIATSLHEARSLEELAAVFLTGIPDLIPCDWPLLSLVTTMPPVRRYTLSPRSVDWDRFAEISLEFATEDPVYTNRLRLLLDGPETVGSFVDDQSFERTRLYNEAWRPLGMKRMLGYYTPGRFVYSLAVSRSSGPEFTRDETLMLHLLGKHIESATTQLVRNSGGMLPMAGGRQRIATSSWIVCAASGAVLRSTPAALQHMRLCLGPAASTASVPPEWLAEYNRRVAGRPAQPFRYSGDAYSVSAHVAPIRGSDGEFSVYFVDYPAAPDPLTPLLRLGVTRREADVLRWITEGKTNFEIGVILGIAELTAKKHVENILHKLNVTSRTAAATVAVEAMQRFAG